MQAHLAIDFLKTDLLSHKSLKKSIPQSELRFLFCTSLKLDTLSCFGLRKNDKLSTRKSFKSPHDLLESTAKTCQFVMWACAAHSRGYFSFPRKVSKSVSKGLPLRYPLRLKIFQNLSKNGTTVPFLGTMARNFIFPQSITLSCPHSHSVTFPLVYHETFEFRGGAERVQEQGVSLDWNRKTFRQNQTEIKVSDSNFLLCQDD